jgi:fumarate reductase (CoM/CoB) subunit A
MEGSWQKCLDVYPEASRPEKSNGGGEKTMGIEKIVDRVIEKEVLVIGTEAAGGIAAIAASEQADVLLVTKSIRGKSGVTIMAVATYSAPLGAEDSPAQTFEDAIIGGRYLNDQHLVDIFSKEAADTVYELEKYGVQWAKEGATYQFLAMPGHKYPRGCYTFPIGTTGRQITSALTKEAKKRNIQVLNDTFVTDLLVKNDRMVGVTAIDLRTGDFLLIKAKCTILATGGGMEVYQGNCGAREATGDGYAMAYRAGIPLRDMEFVQYFPTIMVAPKRLFAQQTPTRLRYELNARLLNFYGERFMRRYDPVRMEKSTRDIVARAIQTEIREGRGTENGGVYMDVSYLPDKVIDAAIARLYPGYDFGGVKLLEEGIDIRKDPFEVAPGAHFFMGGISADEWGEVGLPGLLACGEVVGGVNGANRLGGNALPQMSVFGLRAGKHAAEYARKQEHFDDPDESQVKEIRDHVYGYFSRQDGVKPMDIRKEIQKIMYEDVLCIRDEKGLKSALDRLETIRTEKLQQLALSSRTRKYNLEWLVALEAEKMTDVGEMITRAALFRQESRGAHYRDDFQKEDNKKWLVNLFIRLKEGGMAIERVPVPLDRLKPEEVGAQKEKGGSDE